MAKNSYHFNMGDEPNNRLGLCARINADTPEEAITRLKALLPEEINVKGDLLGTLESDEYVCLYTNELEIGPEHIDDSEDRPEQTNNENN